MILICDNPHERVSPVYDQIMARLSPTLKDHIQQFRFLKDRELSLCGYSLLLEGLEKAYNLKPPVLNFEYSPSGKPSLKAYPEIHFNISHCDAAVACAISDHPVGIDVECISNYTPDLTAYCMNDSEASAIHQSSNPALTFLEFWTQKESLLKLTGEGLRDDMKTVLTDPTPYNFTTHTFPQSNYVCTEAHYTTQKAANRK